MRMISLYTVVPSAWRYLGVYHTLEKEYEYVLGSLAFEAKIGRWDGKGHDRIG